MKLILKTKQMFSIFKKDPIKALEKEYKKLMEDSFNLSKTDRQASDAKREEAEQVAAKIENLKKNT